jgi:hypothetical protein
MSQGLIQGFMREAPLPDIIQLVSQSSKSGCFHIADESRKARIYLREGRIVHALSHDAEGIEAVYEVALWLDGQYNFEETDESIPTTITKSNAAILMEMHRRMDEWRVINQKISSLDLYPHSTLLPGEAPGGISPREARLLGILTGYYSILELAELLQKPALNISKDVYGLIMAGHVIMKGVRSGRRPELPAGLAPVPEPAPVVEPLPVAEALEPVVPEPEPIRMAPAPPLAPAPAAPEPPAVLVDPIRVAKLNAFAQRIAQTAKAALPASYHEQVDALHARATRQVTQGDGPEAVKNLALSISRGAVDAGLDADLVKNLNAQLKALFNK